MDCCCCFRSPPLFCTNRVHQHLIELQIKRRCSLAASRTFPPPPPISDLTHHNSQVRLQCSFIFRCECECLMQYSRPIYIILHLQCSPIGIYRFINSTRFYPSEKQKKNAIANIFLVWSYAWPIKNLADCVNVSTLRTATVCEVLCSMVFERTNVKKINDQNKGIPEEMKCVCAM